MSKVEIVNRALMKLGEPPVSSLNDAVFGKSYEIIYDDISKRWLVVNSEGTGIIINQNGSYDQINLISHLLVFSFHCH